jgi:hypothetical protein
MTNQQTPQYMLNERYCVARDQQRKAHEVLTVLFIKCVHHVLHLQSPRVLITPRTAL